MDSDRRSSGWGAGLRIGAGFAASSFALALSFGAQSRLAGWVPLQSGLFSALTFSGSAQFAVLTALAGGGGALAAIGAGALINMRYLPMGAAAARSLFGGPLRRAVEGQAIVDGSWVAAYRGHGRYDRELLLGASLVQWPAWVGGTVLGCYVDLSASDVDRYGLDVVFPAYFVLLLCDTLAGNRASQRVSMVAGLVSAPALLALPAGAALLLSAASALVVLVQRKKAGTGTAGAPARVVDGAGSEQGGDW